MEHTHGVKINAGLAVLARTPGCLQIGSGSEGIIVDGLAAEDVAFIDKLRGGMVRAGVAAAAAGCGLPPGRAEALLEALAPVLVETDTGVVPLKGLRAERLDPDARQWSAGYRCDGHAVVARRARTVVQVSGLCRTGSAVAQALAAAGIGTLILDDPAAVTPQDVGAGSYRLADVGMPRVQATRRQIRNIDPTIQAHPAPDPAAWNGPAPVRGTAPSSRSRDPAALDLAVCVGGEAAARAACASVLRADLPHLAVLLREQDSQVGPLVVPGRSACLDCIDRAGTETGWPADGDGFLAGGTGGTAGEVTQALGIAGLAAMQALLFVDGVNRPSAWSAAWQLRSSDGLITRRTFRQHPDCGCRLPETAPTEVA